MNVVDEKRPWFNSSISGTIAVGRVHGAEPSSEKCYVLTTRDARQADNMHDSKLLTGIVTPHSDRSELRQHGYLSGFLIKLSLSSCRCGFRHYFLMKK